MTEKKKLNSWWERLQKKSRYVVLNNETFEEQRSFTLSPFNMIIYVLFAVILVIGLSYFIFSFTPLNGLIPNVPNSRADRELLETGKQNLVKLDELEQSTKIKARYIENIHALLNGEIPENGADDVTSKDTMIDYNNIQFPSSEEDSILRLQVENEDRYSISGNEEQHERDDKMKGVFFFTPLEGEVTNSFGGAAGHNGIDIIAPKNEAVKSTLNGTIIFAGWTTSNGHVIYVQHAHNLVSVYKHNSVLLKAEGEKVRAGEPIAIVGNTGELSSGAHLHFELWYNGNPMDPQEFIAF